MGGMLRGPVASTSPRLPEPSCHKDGQGDLARFSEIRNILWIPEHPHPKLNGRWLLADGGSLRTVTPDGLVETFAQHEALETKGSMPSPVRLDCLALAPAREGQQGPRIFVSDSARGVVWILEGQGQFRILTAPSEWKPTGLSVDPAGHLYLADGARRMVQRCAPDGKITQVGQRDELALGRDGKNGTGSLCAPGSLVVDPYTGDLLVADGCAIRRITPEGDIATLAGRTTKGAYADWPAETPLSHQGALGQGIPCFGRLAAITLAGTDLYIADPDNNALRRLNLATGELVTLLGGPGLDRTRFGPLHRNSGTNQAAIAGPVAIAFDGAGTCLVANGHALFQLVLARPEADGCQDARKGRPEQIAFLNPPLPLWKTLVDQLPATPTLEDTAETMTAVGASLYAQSPIVWEALKGLIDSKSPI